MKLWLKNFRSYKDAVIEFGPGVTAITGENDSGKSNILRAINWVVNNKPSGEDYRSNFGGDTSVLLDIDNKVVGRHRTNSGNSYTLTHASGEINEFKAFGTGVPEIIRQHLNIGPENIAFQLEGPFLLGKSAADVARHFNNAVNLDIIDSTISNIASTLRNERGQLKAEKERKETLAEKLKTYDWLVNAETQLAELERGRRIITNLKSDWSMLYPLIKDFKKLEETSRTLGEITKHSKNAKELAQQNNDIGSMQAHTFGLRDLITEFKSLANTDKNLNEIARWEETVKSLSFQAQDIAFLKTDASDLRMKIASLKRLIAEENEHQRIAKHTERVSALIELNNKIIEGSKEHETLYDILEQYDKLVKQIADADNKLTDLNFEFKESMPTVCPLCGQGVELHD